MPEQVCLVLDQMLARPQLIPILFLGHSRRVDNRHEAIGIKLRQIIRIQAVRLDGVSRGLGMLLGATTSQ